MRNLLRRHRLKVGAVVLATGGLVAALSAPALSASPQAAPQVPAPRASAQAAATPEGLIGVTPTRVLDTRQPIGVAVGFGPLGPGETVNVPLTTAAPNRPGIPVPSGAKSVLLNVTVDRDATAVSFITVWPTGQARPNASVTNPTPGTIVTGSILVPLGTGGSISVFNFAGNAQVIIDLTGYTMALSGSGGPKVTFDADAAASTTAAVQTNFADFTGGTLIRDLTLPAGSYDIAATTSVRGAQTDGPAAPALNTRVRCNLVNATANPVVGLDTFYVDFFRPDEASPGFRQSLQVGALVTFAVTTKVQLRCYSVRPGGGTNAGQVPSSKIVATQVATITAGH
jgi:hypothetical protein